MNKKYTKDFLIRELAERADFSITDVRYLWDVFENLVIEIVKNKDTLMVGGLFKIYAKKAKSRRFYNLQDEKMSVSTERYGVNIVPSSNLKRAAREEIIDSEEIEE